MRAYRMIHGQATEANVYAMLRDDTSLYALDLDRRTAVVIVDLKCESAAKGPFVSLISKLPLPLEVAHTLFEALGTILGRTYEKRNKKAA